MTSSDLSNILSPQIGYTIKIKTLHKIILRSKQKKTFQALCFAIDYDLSISRQTKQLVFL